MRFGELVRLVEGKLVVGPWGRNNDKKAVSSLLSREDFQKAEERTFEEVWIKTPEDEDRHRPSCAIVIQYNGSGYVVSWAFGWDGIIALPTSGEDFQSLKRFVEGTDL